jgi:hypothetical protein
VSTTPNEATGIRPIDDGRISFRRKVKESPPASEAPGDDRRAAPKPMPKSMPKKDETQEPDEKK